DFKAGEKVLAMLEALGCRGPDSAGLAMIRPNGSKPGVWRIRLGPLDIARGVPDLEGLGEIEHLVEHGDTVRLSPRPNAGVAVGSLERALGLRPGGLEIMSLGEQLDLVKQVGTPEKLNETYRVGVWRGPAAIGHTRLSTESRIDLGHSQPFWA